MKTMRHDTVGVWPPNGQAPHSLQEGLQCSIGNISICVEFIPSLCVNPPPPISMGYKVHTAQVHKNTRSAPLIGAPPLTQVGIAQQYLPKKPTLSGW